MLVKHNKVGGFATKKLILLRNVVNWKLILRYFDIYPRKLDRRSSLPNRPAELFFEKILIKVSYVYFLKFIIEKRVEIFSLLNCYQI